MGYLLTVLSGFSFFKRRDDDDFIDRLHYFLTTNFLVMLSILVSWKQFGGKPIECMVPDQFPHGWEQYAENYCWAQDTYFLPFHEKVPKDVSERTDGQISYYQWVPFFLIIQAVCFSLPAMLWHMLSGNSGMKVQTLVRLAKDSNNIKPEIRKNTITTLTVYLENALRFHRRLVRKRFRPHQIFRCMNLPYKACYVTSLYLSVKILSLINVIIQFFLMNAFLQTSKYSYYGLGALSDMLNGTQWQNTGIFPRVTLCDFEVRVMANVQRYTIQCVLIINLFNEKIFIFLWFWYCILAFLTLASFIHWFILLALPWPQRWFIVRHLELSEMPFNAKSQEKDLEKFVGAYLRTDGVFVLRMITLHTGLIFGTDLVLHLWRSFYGIETEFQRQNSKDLEPDPFPEACSGKQHFNNVSTIRLRSLLKPQASKEASDSASKTVPGGSLDDLLKLKQLQPVEHQHQLSLQAPLPTRKKSIAELEFNDEVAAKPVCLSAKEIERLQQLLQAPMLDQVDHGAHQRASISRVDGRRSGVQSPTIRIRGDNNNPEEEEEEESDLLKSPPSESYRSQRRATLADEFSDDDDEKQKLKRRQKSEDSEV